MKNGLRRHWQIWIGGGLVGLVVLIALAAPWLAPPVPAKERSTYKEVEIEGSNQLKPIPPGEGLPLGSVPDGDNLRQLDVWYSLVWGTRPALVFGIAVVSLTGIFGVLLGTAGGYLGGLPNALSMGFTDAFLALPMVAGVIFFQQFVLMLLRATGVLIYGDGSYEFLTEPTSWQLFLSHVDPLLLAFIVFSWMPYSRLINAVALHARQEEYIVAAKALGAGHLRIVMRHLLPNSIGPTIVLAARDVGYLVLLQAGFTFIGLSDRSTWGTLLSLGRNWIIGPGGSLLRYWWVFIPPTLALVLFGIGWNLLGDGLNDYLNPKTRRL